MLAIGHPNIESCSFPKGTMDRTSSTYDPVLDANVKLLLVWLQTKDDDRIRDAISIRLARDNNIKTS